MRPSQYHYIKRTLSRTLYNRKIQKKRTKKRKKELRKQKREMKRNKHNIPPKRVKTSSPKHSQEELKIIWFTIGKIFFGALAIVQPIRVIAEWNRLVIINGAFGNIGLLIVNIAVWGGLSYLFSFFINREHNKNTDQTIVNDNTYHFVANEKYEQENSQHTNTVAKIKESQSVSELYNSKVENTSVDETLENSSNPTINCCNPAENEKKSENKSKVTIENPDYYLKEAAELIISKEKASIGMLQRNFKIGFNRADRIINQLGEMGIVGPEYGTMPRKILVSLEDIDAIFSNTTFRTGEKVENENIQKFSDEFVALCVANCELDKEQNYTDNITGGNVKYNEKRFDNLANDSVISGMVSNEEIKEVSDKVLHVYNEIGLMVIIDETLCTNQYVVLKLKPMHGTRITDIISVQNTVESMIRMKSLMNVMYKKGYVGMLLPIHQFIKKKDDKNPTTDE